MMINCSGIEPAVRLSIDKLRVMTNTSDAANQQERWERRYADGKTPWDRGQASPALTQALAQIPPPPARILVPACGRGHEVTALASMGYKVSGVDFAASAIRHLSQSLTSQHLQADVIFADLFAWNPDGPVDVIYEQTAICALEPALWPSYASRLAQWLRPGGTLIGLFMQTAREGGPPWHVPLSAIKSLFPETIWSWPADPVDTVMHPSGLRELLISLKRRD